MQQEVVVVRAVTYLQRTGVRTSVVESAALDEPEIVIELRDVLSVGMWWSSAKRNFIVSFFRVASLSKLLEYNSLDFHLQ